MMADLRLKAGFLGLVATLAAWPMVGAAVNHGTPSGPLSLASPVRPIKGPEQIYLVQLIEAAVLNYRGTKSGYAATKPAPGRKLNRASGAVESYVSYLDESHDRLLRDVGAPNSKVYSFRYALNGFAARLTSNQISRLKRSGTVARVWLDTEQQVQTNNSAIFLGLQDQNGGLRADLELRGEDIIIAVIDSGIAPNHPSLADTEDQIPRGCTTRWSEASWLGVFLCSSIKRNPPTTLMFEEPQGFTGICQAGDGFTESTCNNKLIGARYYLDGFLARNELDPGEFVSPKDADGHGTHIASIAAGISVTAEMFGTRLGQISGIAPRARIAVYKACWLKPGETRASCSTADLTRAIDDAVADGVDIINYSVGSLETDLTAPDDLALLNALQAGVFSAVAAGNDGPNAGTIGSPSGAPWVLTVGASTQSGSRFEEAIAVTAPESLAQLMATKEASFTPPLRDRDPVEQELRLVDDGQAFLSDGSPGSVRDACEALENAADLEGQIALIERGGCLFQVKLERVEQAGAIAAVVYNNNGDPIVMNGDADTVGIPAVMIATADGQTLVDELLAETVVRIELSKGTFIERSETGNVMAEFSSRGPSPGGLDFLKPDVTAPGVHILAAHTPDVANGLTGERYQYLSGTSMSTPEVAGVAALLKEAHPEWTPSQIKSALMTSAYQEVVKETGATAADPFDVGAGHIDPNRAIDPGLVYDVDFLNYAAYLCGLDDPPFPPTDCAILAVAGFSSDGRDLNVPSIGIAELISGDVITRRVTNVGPAGTYTPTMTAPLGIDMLVTPTSLSLNTGEIGEFSITMQRQGAALDTWSFGRLSWSDGSRIVASPIAVRPVTLRAPQELGFRGATGADQVPVAFGYSGAYRADVHGLRAALTDFCFDDENAPAPCFVGEDTTNDFSFRIDNGVRSHLIDIPAGQLYARFSLFDEFTDGADDLDLYLFYCPNNQCTQIAQSGSFTSDEEINLTMPAAGPYAALVHGFETDQIVGGPGALYTLFAWSFGTDDIVGNLQVTSPVAVSDGERQELDLAWGPLAPATRYLGAISHNTPTGRYGLTILRMDSR
ncbi:MAG: S8 family serine peptidase [Gammaproteobacteria bacterium]|nr:S8 family serine peptidase [Gammaproteobacteria bacterium]